jgi:tetratricopeptide (TPR) repeat protein
MSAAPNSVVSDPLEILQQVQLAPRLVEDYRPLHESLEWRLSQNHWSSTGALSFIRSEVPYAITSSGTLSAQAARVFHGNCLESAPAGKITVLETGAGSGLFARLFLEEFERLCLNSGHDFYSRLTYFVTDGSAESVEQWRTRGIFDGKPAVPGIARAADPLLVETGPAQVRLSGLRAVFANYVLDSVPAAVIRQSPNGAEELHVRAHLVAHPEAIRHDFAVPIEDLRRMAANTDAKLLDLIDLLEFEAAFLPVSRAYPHMDEALTFGHDWPRIMLNYGAFDYLERVIAELDSHGFILINDYGQTQASDSVGLGSVQRFGPTAAMGLNFPLMAHHFSKRGLCISRPELDERLPLHPFLISPRQMALTEQRFDETFSWETYREMTEPAEAARKHVDGGRIEQAGHLYEQALRARPRDWALVGEIAEFLIRHVGDFEAGRKMAEAALAINPWYSVWLWNLYGDALYALNRFAEAHEIYLKAEALSPNDVRTAMNLGYTYWELGSPDQALQAIARGLTNDGSGQFHDRLLEKQAQIVAKLNERFRRNQEWHARRAARMSAD